jgi:hypothetical protein
MAALAGRLPASYLMAFYPDLKGWCLIAESIDVPFDETGAGSAAGQSNRRYGCIAVVECTSYESLQKSPNHRQ